MVGEKQLWGDGTKYELYEENLLSEYHIRYGGYGGIAYHHVSDTYVALFSHGCVGEGNAVYYLTDAMGTVIGLADGNGASSGKFLYDAFGNILSQVRGVDGAAGGDFRFQGQWLESESGLYYFRARDYDPATGLFLSRDLGRGGVLSPST